MGKLAQYLCQGMQAEDLGQGPHTIGGCWPEKLAGVTGRGRRRGSRAGDRTMTFAQDSGRRHWDTGTLAGYAG